MKASNEIAMDFYILLGIERDATLGDIKRAYKRLARKYHPDINPGDRLAAVQFRRIAEAYETLSDPDRRQRYDTVGPSMPEAAPVAFGFDGFDFSVSVSGSSAPTFGDLFADVLRARHHQSGDDAPARGADLHQSMTLSFEDAMRGGQRSVTVIRQDACRTCRGSGRQNTAERRCPQCQGIGVLRSARGHMVFSKACPQCRGTGRQVETRCPACAGQQVETRSETLTIALPPGLHDGARISVAGKGHAGLNGGEPGDLHVVVRVAPHHVFRREGDDLHVLVPVAIHEAALGAKIEVPSIDGPARLRVPPGTQTGQQFRLHERGAPSPRDGRRGDLVVEVRLALPRVLDERSKELLREFGRLNGDDVRQEIDRSLLRRL
jgi:molecular chaperone DnaJ